LLSIGAPAVYLRRRRLSESRRLMRIKWLNVIIVLLIIAACGVMMSAPSQNVKAQMKSPKEGTSGSDNLSKHLASALRTIGFTGKIESKLEKRLGHKIDNHLADLGRLAFHDSLLGLNDDNSCSGCHAAPSGFGDTQSIAIGIENNNIVGPDRA